MSTTTIPASDVADVVVAAATTWPVDVALPTAYPSVVAVRLHNMSGWHLAGWNAETGAWHRAPGAAYATSSEARGFAERGLPA